jgi:hypothetical protein
LAAGFAIALGGGLWAYDVWGPRIRASWPTWKAEGAPWLRETLLWIEFLASITLTVALLCWCTALSFCLLCALVFGLPYLLDWLGKRVPRPEIDRLRRGLELALQRERLLGTLCNLIASAAALVCLARILRRPLDYWDVGIQILISAAFELIVLQVLFAEGRLDWPWNQSA